MDNSFPQKTHRNHKTTVTSPPVHNFKFQNVKNQIKNNSWNWNYTVACKSIDIPWTCPCCLTLQPQTLIYFLGISCERPIQSGTQLWSRKIIIHDSKYFFFFTNRKLKSVVWKCFQSPWVDTLWNHVVLQLHL